MKCPLCKDADTKVLESREQEDAYVTRRRRECLQCARRFTTYERIEFPELLVIKKDGSKQKFDREKIIKGLTRAFEKRPIEQERILVIAQDIERKIRTHGEITTKKIGSMIMRKLKSIDEVAYIRFASVYKDFQDVGAFEAEVLKIKG